MANISGGSVVWTLDVDNSKFNAGLIEAKAKMNDIGDSGKSVGSKLSGALSAIGKSSLYAAAGIAATAAVFTPFVKDAIRRVDTLKNSARTFENMGFAAKDTAEATKALEKSILGLPTPLDSAMRGMTALAATYGDVKGGQKVFTALNNAILGFGGTAAEVENAVRQLSQLPMDGPLDAQTWNSLRNSGLTPVLVAMAKDMGIGVNEMKKKFGEGELTVQDFTIALTRMNKEGGGGMKSLEQIARDSTKGIGTSIENLKTAIVRGFAVMIEAIGSEKIAGAINNLSKNLKNVFEFIIRNADTIAVFIGTILATAFGVLAVKVLLATYPILLVAAAVTGLYLLFKRFRPQIQQVIDAFKRVWEAAKPLRDFIGEQLRIAFESIVSIAKQVWTSLQPVIDVIKQILANKTVQKVLKYIGIALAAIVALPVVVFFASLIAGLKILSSVLKFVADHFEGIKKVIVTLIKVALIPIITPILIIIGVIKLLQYAWKKTTEGIKKATKIWQDISKSIKKAIGDMTDFVVQKFNTVKDFIVKVWQGVWKILKPILTFILNLYIIVWGTIAIVVITAVQKVWQFIQFVWNAIYGFISEVLSRIFNFYSRVFKAIYNTVVTISQAVGSFISGVMNWIWNVITSIWNTIYNFVKARLTAMLNFYRSIFNAILGVIRSVISSIWNFFAPAVSWLYNAGRRVISGLVNGLRSAASWVWHAIASVSGQIGRFFSGAVHWLWDAGRAIIIGIVNGLRSGAGWVYNEVANIANNVKSKFKSLLGIHSPSKVFADFGKNMTAGLVQGIDRTAGLVDKAVTGLSNTATADIGVQASGVPNVGTVGNQSGGNTQQVEIGTVVLNTPQAVKSFFDELNRDSINLGMGLTPVQGN